MRGGKRIVVMGGSFNPPTLAHYKLMKVTIDALEADIGFFVPVSDAYLRRKMRHSHPPVVLSPELRVKMLQSMCMDSRMRVCEKEIGTIEPRTMPTLMALQEDYPDAELYSVMGADKLKLLTHLTEKRDFLKTFRVVLYSREGGAINEMLKIDGLLTPYMDHIVTLPQPVGIETISSSKVRELMLLGKNCQDMLCPGVWELFKEFSPADFPDVINQFKDEYDYLSNRFGCRFVWQGVQYGNAEAAFQSSKCEDEAARLAIMKSILQAKFEQNPALMEKLKQTGNRILINGNNKQETFWGVDLYSWQGENHLGKILMYIRDEEIQR